LTHRPVDPKRPVIVSVILDKGRAVQSTQTKKPNILVIFGDDIGWFNISAYNMGIMGYRTIAEMLKPLGYTTGQFGKNHLGDGDEFLPTMHGFDEFFGNLYHLNAEEEPENPDYPKDPAFRRMFGPRGVFGRSRSSRCACRSSWI
jgi:arylsulfatase A-like enzyme